MTVRLRGHFDPISGWYNWCGRVAASPDVERFGAAPFEVLDTLPDRDV